MLSIRLPKTLLTEDEPVVSRMPTSEMQASTTVPDEPGCGTCRWMVAKTSGKTRSRAIDNVMRADGQQGGLGGAHRRGEHGDDHDVADPLAAHLVGEVEEHVGALADELLGRQQHLGGDDVEQEDDEQEEHGR